MEKDLQSLQRKFDSIVSFIKEELDNALKLDCCDVLREEYAISIATRLRVLLNDEGKNCSLLTLLGKKQDYRFPEVAVDVFSRIPSNMCFSSLLTSLQVTPQGLFCKVNEFRVAEDLLYTFEAWWNEVVIDSKHETLSQISRRDIVLVLVDKEGGAHVDKKYEEAYWQVRNGNGIKYVNTEGQEVDIQNNFYIESLLYIAQEFLNAYLIGKNVKPFTFSKVASNYKIIQITYFREREFRGKTLFEKRYRFIRYKKGSLLNMLTFSFDYYQIASYRLLDIYQINKEISKDKMACALVLDIENDSNQIIYARTENCEVRAILVKSGNKYQIYNEEEESLQEESSLEDIKLKLYPTCPNSFDSYFKRQLLEEWI